MKKVEKDKRATIYARYSSHNQKDVSIDQQIDACKKWAAGHGYTLIPQIYHDHAVSGKTDNRPEFQRMLKDAESGAFSYVIAWKSNRMGRNMLQAMVNEARLNDLGVKCLYVEEDFADTAAGRFALRNMMNVNQFYIENMAEDVIRGMMDNAQKCKINGRIPLGYKRANDGTYAIDDSGAAVVREIFQRIIDGWSITDIMLDLNNRHIKTGMGREWRLQSFQTLLTNENYIGVYKFNGIRIEDGIPPIITREQFDAVQHILKGKGRPRGVIRNNKKYLLTGKCFCGLCGSPMGAQCGTSKSGKKHDYYMCNRKRYDHACEKKNVPKDALESAVIETIRSELMSDEFVEWIVGGYQKAISQVDRTGIAALKSELADVNMKLDNILKAIEAGIWNEQTQARMTELTATRKDLEAEIRAEEIELPTADDIRQNLLKLRTGDLTDREYMAELIRVFVRAVYVFDDTVKIQFNYGTEKNAPGMGACSKEQSLGSPTYQILNTFPVFTIPFRW